MIGSLMPYPKYKDSGLPWLTEVPEHWNLPPNRALLRRRKVLVGERHTQYRLLSLTKEGVIVRDVGSGKGKFSADMGTSQEVRAGDLVFCLFDVPETPRTVGLSRHDGMITGAYTVFECSDPVLSTFLDLFYRAMDDRKLLGTLYSGLRNTIPPTRFLGIKTPVPPAVDQAAIVRFLDHADQRIRYCLRGKQKLINLLEEQKQIIIHRSVTRGLDPGVPLTPSGVEWLGDVPAHWEQHSLWTLSRLRSERNPGDLPLLSVFLDRGVIRYEDGGGQVHAPSLDLANYQVVHPGDFVLNNQQAWRGSVGVSTYHGIISPAYIVLRLSDRLNSVYANYLLRCVAMVDQFVAASKGVGDIQRQIYWPYLRRVQVPLPPIEEQQNIARHVQSATQTLDVAIDRARREMSLLRECRTRLIADVVTGRVDVRDAVKSLPQVTDEPAELEETESLLGNAEQSEEGLETHPVTNDYAD